MIEHHRQLLFRGIILEFQRRARGQLDAGHGHVGAIEIDAAQILEDRRKRYGLYADRLFLFPVETQFEFDVSLIVIVRWNILRRRHWPRRARRRRRWRLSLGQRGARDHKQRDNEDNLRCSSFETHSQVHCGLLCLDVVWEARILALSFGKHKRPGCRNPTVREGAGGRRILLWVFEALSTKVGLVSSAKRTTENSPAIYRWELGLLIEPSPRSGRQTGTEPLAVASGLITRFSG